jgi:hypothetical protein
LKDDCLCTFDLALVEFVFAKHIVKFLGHVSILSCYLRVFVLQFFLLDAKLAVLRERHQVVLQEVP